ncbi:MAG: hypothetical protein JXA89_25570, partial [Anaerolineae bacterium]|nr:hypothetical protein [Anaerolineae bacterium]
MIAIPSVTFSGLAFTPSAVTLACPVEPAEYEVQETADGIAVRVTRCVIGDSDQTYDGSMTLRIWRETGGALCWQAEAQMPDPIKGVRVEIEPLACERVHTPTGREVWEVTDEQAFSGQFPYPRSGAFVWAQCLFLESTEGIWMLRSEDHPPRYQRYRVERMEGGCRLMTYLEPLAFARRPACTTPVWRLERVPDLVSGARQHSEWMAQAYGWRSLEERGDVAPWLLDISLCVYAYCCSGYGSITMTFSQLEERLRQIAKHVDPHRTLLQLVGWDGLLDWRHPDYEPDPRLGGNSGFQKLMHTAHTLGFRVGTHLNIQALGTKNPQFEELKHFLAHEVRDSSGIPLLWQRDLNGDGVAENNHIFISPDHEPWRVYQRARILKHVR